MLPRIVTSNNGMGIPVMGWGVLAFSTEISPCEKMGSDRILGLLMAYVSHVFSSEIAHR